ncbi:diguanylate cyclase [Sulfurovum sp. zt1-1]|uniref:Diguanylate cyclase n=1 Tax=Sulfurovum zhangzhouensis TaxID=3019067 RepID=A0ABT7R0R5_9BACT|nr:diguanylate cyclase [Sulfurovum zhangzhouensis]MDM5272684.1 diguanylate cyclase [Sulfurovum zhangzhouensis]
MGKMGEMGILIVDDDKTTISILHHMLKPYADRIYLASDGEEGLSHYKTYQPDLILSDINMPRMNGLEMVEEIRKIDEDVKIAIFTDFEKRDILLKAIELGVNQFLSKPFEAKSFSKTIQQLYHDIIEKRDARYELERQEDILHAINEMSHSFLQQPDWLLAMYKEMKNLKNAARASCIFIYENEHDKTCSSAHKLLYINDNEKAKGKQNIHYQKHHLMRWKNKLKKNQLINGNRNDYDKSKIKLLKLFKINSLLILPIFVQDRWWGFLGIGNGHAEVLQESNVEMLSTAASIIGSAINNSHNRKSLEISSAVFKHTMDGVVITDAKNNIVHVNDACLEITGYDRNTIIGKNPRVLKSGNHDKQFYQKMWHQLHHEGCWQGEITNRKKNGEFYIEWLSINAIKDSQGKIENFIAVFSDITHHHKNTREQAFLATHDPLTGLSNRIVLNDRLEHAIEHAQRFDKHISLIFCDLDNFKPINDTYGHTVGDEILKRVGYYLKELLRKEDTVCRFGGDEFVILIEELENFHYLDKVLKRINKLTATPCVIDGKSINIGMSIGASIYPYDGTSSELLVKAADQAMYRAKRSGKNCIEYAQANTQCYLFEKPLKDTSLNYVI